MLHIFNRLLTWEGYFEEEKIKSHCLPEEPDANILKKTKHSIVLVDLIEFPPIFQKVQHSHPSRQKTTSNLLRSNFKGILKFNEVIMPTRGSYVHNFMAEFSVASQKCMVSDKKIHRAFSKFVSCINCYELFILIITCAISNYNSIHFF